MPSVCADGGDPGGPSIFDAVQKSLELRLEQTKSAVKVFVIDHAAKSPAGN
jgi:uncharacterized protein (TIGR03435 family)